jgi:AcrR family transcriptional regulator
LLFATTFREVKVPFTQVCVLRISSYAEHIPGLRERKKAEMRTTLAWAAIQLVVERGYDGVKVGDIAEAADVSPRTFNNYFSSKAEAIASRHLDRMLRAADVLRERPAAEPLWTAIEAAALSVLEPGPELAGRAQPDRESPGHDSPGHDSPSHDSPSHDSPSHDSWVAGVALMITEPALQGEMLRAGAIAERALATAIGVRTGTDPERDLYPRLVAATITAANAAATEHYLHTDPFLPMEQIIAEALNWLAAGLPGPATRPEPGTRPEPATRPKPESRFEPEGQS